MMVVFGAANLAILLAVMEFKRYAFTSLWCAYAAIASVIILVYFLEKPRTAAVPLRLARPATEPATFRLAGLKLSRHGHLQFRWHDVRQCHDYGVSSCVRDFPPERLTLCLGNSGTNLGKSGKGGITQPIGRNAQNGGELGQRLLDWIREHCGIYRLAECSRAPLRRRTSTVETPKTALPGRHRYEGIGVITPRLEETFEPFSLIS